MVKQECIPVGCVTSAAVAISGEGGVCPGLPRRLWVSAWWGCLPKGNVCPVGCLPMRGICLGGVHPPDSEVDTPCGLNDRRL